MGTATVLTVLNRDPVCAGWLRPTSSVTVLDDPDVNVALATKYVLVFALASELEEVAEFVREANKRHHLRAFLVHADVEERWIAQMLDRADLRTLRNLLVHRGCEQPRRVLEAWKAGCQDALIADAIALPDRLIVLTCALERLEIPWGRVRALATMKAGERRNFELSIDGSYLHWPERDVHLDVDAFRVAVDPAARAAAELELHRHNERFGLAVGNLRRSRGLRQRDIPGVNPRHLRRVESGEVFPRVTTLEKLSAAHGLTLSQYLEELARIQTSEVA